MQHLNLMQAQIDIKITKEFALKWAHLNDFLKSAYSDPSTHRPNR